MKKGVKVLGLFLLGLLMLSVLASVVIGDPAADAAAAAAAEKAAAAEAARAASWEKFKTGASDFFGAIFGVTLTGKGVFELAFTKFMVFLLIFLVILGLSDMLPFLGGEGGTKKFIQWAFSIVAAYLTVIFIAPEEIYAALIGWGAMGVTITAVIPFAIIFAMTYKLVEQPDPGKQLLVKLILWTFLLYLGYRVAYLVLGEGLAFAGVISAPSANIYVAPFALPLYAIMFGVTLIFAIFNKTIQNYLLSTKIKSYIAAADTLSKEEAMADAIMFRERAVYADRANAPKVAANLRAAADRMDKHAKAVSE